ncbi:MAG TPA: dNTP triphosphohydrolase [Hanamia sp.]|nr:dNTP triphosphohydrolase [Hanamia sp.]
MAWDNYLNSSRLRTSTRNIAGDPRNEFESDLGRVIFSPAIRRMHDKTQVFPLTTDDHIHSRLTHSMEVMAIGYSLGIRLSENEKFIKMTGEDSSHLLRIIPIILKNACLVHDIGNPPFGHFGEDVIKNYFTSLFNAKVPFELSEIEKQDFTNFDGNAQGFRILTKLEVLDNAFGLNLSLGTLGAYLKYPNADKIDPNNLAMSKRGVFQSERDYLAKIVEGCGLKKSLFCKRHPLAFIMEAADSICYLVMDIEDGFNKGYYNYEFIKESLKNIDGINEIFIKIEKEHNTYGAEITRMVNLRIYLISRLVNLAMENFILNFNEICNGDYNKELIKDDKTGLAKTLYNFCIKNIFSNREIQSLELTGHSVLTGLLDYYINFIFHEDKNYRKRAQGMISKSLIRAVFIENNLNESNKIDDLTPYFKLRLIVDFITGMTDQFALNHYQKLSGQKII